MIYLMLLLLDSIRTNKRSEFRQTLIETVNKTHCFNIDLAPILTNK